MNTSTMMPLTVLMVISASFAIIVIVLGAVTLLRRAVAGPQPVFARLALGLVVVGYGLLAVVKPQIPGIPLDGAAALMLSTGLLIAGVMALMEIWRQLRDMPRLFRERR